MNLLVPGAIALLLFAAPAGAQITSTVRTPPAAPSSTASSTAAETAPAPHAVPAQGQGLNLGKHDTNAPINVASDNFEGDFETKVGTYTGNVIVTQADYKLRADSVRVDVINGQPNKFYAEGKVVFESPKGVATGDHGIYDLTPPRTITMTGNVILTKEKDVMRGTRLVVNLVSGESHLTAAGMPGNRVQSLFIPKPHPASGSKTQTTTDSSADDGEN